MYKKTISFLKNTTLANKITLFRIALIPIILLFLHFATKWTSIIACILFAIASISDYFDGYFARKSGEITTLGKFLDPLADKLLICAILVEMTALGWVPSWIVNIIIARELAITGLRAIAADKNIVLAADKYGKWKTGFQLMALTHLTLHFSYFSLPIHEIGMFFLYISLFLTVYSAINYFINFKQLLSN